MVAHRQRPVSVPEPTDDAIQPLTAADVGRLRLSWQSRWRASELTTTLQTYPSRSAWVPATREFAIVTPWRHRPEVPVISELVAPRHAANLIPAVVDRCRTAGDNVFLMVELDETRPQSFYRRARLDLLDHVMTYELAFPPVALPSGSPLEFRHVDPADDDALATLASIDHGAFPWLWWNSELEFAAYGRTPGVQMFLGSVDGRPVSYIGVTSYPGWGHLDRIAVMPASQGAGYGWWSLAFAIGHLARRGARRIGLSTQLDNLRSRRLYEGFGFRRALGNDYRLYGVVLRQPEGYTITTHPL